MRLLLAITFALALFVPDGAEEGRRGNELFRQGNYAEAITVYRQGLARMTADPSPVRAGLYNNLGMAQYQQEKFAEARQAFNDGMAVATTTDGTSRLAYNAGNASFREKQLEEALAYYREALLSNPDNENAKFNYEYVKRQLDGQGKGQNQSQDNQNNQNQNQQQNNQGQQNNQQNQNQQQSSNQNQEDQQRQQNQQQQQDQQSRQNQQQQQQQGQQNEEHQDQGQSSSGQQQSEAQQSQGGQQQAGEQQRKLSQEEARLILQALENSEENLLRRMSPQQQPEDRNVEKDW